MHAHPNPSFIPSTFFNSLDETRSCVALVKKKSRQNIAPEPRGQLLSRMWKKDVTLQSYGKTNESTVVNDQKNLTEQLCSHFLTASFA